MPCEFGYLSRFVSRVLALRALLMPNSFLFLPRSSRPELTWLRLSSMSDKAYAVHPLIGGGVAEWLKAAVC